MKVVKLKEDLYKKAEKGRCPHRLFHRELNRGFKINARRCM